MPNIPLRHAWPDSVTVAYGSAQAGVQVFQGCEAEYEEWRTSFERALSYMPARRFFLIARDGQAQFVCVDPEPPRAALKRSAPLLEFDDHQGRLF